MPLRLAAAEYGAGLPLAIRHGLFGSGRNWASIAKRLAADRRVVAFDLRNHGASPWADTMTYGEMAEDVCASLSAHGHRRSALLGHSMGGKVAMVAALLHPDMVERLIVADIAPVAYRPHHLGLVRAMRGLDLTAVRRRAEADRRLHSAVPDPAERAFLLQNLMFEDGTARWRINLDAIERAMASLAGFPPMPPGTAYQGPTLFVGGGRSDYLRAEHGPEIRRLFPKAQIARIPETGHWLHADRPDAFVEEVGRFLTG
ncbi:MAG: alpha/beta fold hydrolase [Alphaproteobacteria bacterium]